MGCQGCPHDPAALLVADTSVVINLSATGRAAAILEAVPDRVAVVEHVALEIETDRRSGRDDAGRLDALAVADLVGILRLGNPGLVHFMALVSGPAAQSLDDGEAATIACALERGAAVLIDERKAIRICAERFPALNVSCTVDLLARAAVEAALGRDELAEAAFDALRFARMRVPPRRYDWIVDLIGRDRARQCPSLPKSLRSQ